MIVLKNEDYSRQFFEKLPPSFDVQINGELLHSRSIAGNKIWMGKSVMKKFENSNFMLISKKGNKVIIK